MILKEKMKKKTTKFEAVNNKNVQNKAYLDTKYSKLEGQISYIEIKITKNSNCLALNRLWKRS